MRVAILARRGGWAQRSLGRLGLKRGGTWLNAVNDQVAGVGAVFVPGTRRDSLHILDTLLNLDAGPNPEMVTTETASYSDIVFGPFRLLGYRFSPRIADMGGTQFWRTGPPAGLPGDYGPLSAIARGKVNLDRVRTHWPNMLRVAGSLVTRKVCAYDLLRMISRDGNPTPLGQAFAEYGRVDKTLHLLAMVDPVDESWRRVTRQLNIQESWHRWQERSSTGSAASCARRTGKVRKTSSARSVWSSTPWCCGTPPLYRRRGTRAARRRAAGYRRRCRTAVSARPRACEPARPLRLPSAQRATSAGAARPGRTGQPVLTALRQVSDDPRLVIRGPCDDKITSGVQPAEQLPAGHVAVQALRKLG